MRRMLLVTGCVLLLAVGARAQDSLLGQVEGALGGGASIPLGDFDDLANVGFLITPRVGTYVRPNVAVGIEYGYFNHGASDDLIFFIEQTLGINVDASFSIHQFTGYGKILLTPNRFTPYLRGQLGLYRVTASVDVTAIASGSTSENSFGLGGGGGVQFRGQGPLGGFVDAIFHVAFTEDNSTDFLGIQAGIQYLFGTSR